MNRNDLAVPPTFASHSGDAERALTPRSPKKSLSPASRRKNSVGSVLGGGTGTSDFPKAAPVLEGESVHFALPSFHARRGTGSGVWKCLGCSHENHSALSNECSVCGMTRNVSFHSNEVISESSNCDSDTFNYDGNASENSLSLHNSFSIVDANLGDELTHANYSFGHASLPVGLGSSISSLVSSLPTTTRFHNSFSVEQQSRPVSRRNRTGRRVLNRLRGGADLDQEEEEGHSSVRSFSDWNGNEKIKSWACPKCTFVNENHLNLACDMCGHVQETDDNNNDGPSVSVPPVITGAPTGTTSETETGNNTNTNNDDETVLDLLRAEQLRELVSLQREILASLDGEGAEGAEAEGSAFQTEDLDREICQIQAELYSSNHTATQRSIGLEQLEPGVAVENEDEDEEDEESRLQELLANQIDILNDFQAGRRQSPRTDKKPPVSTTAMSSAGLATSSASSSSLSSAPIYSDPLFGGSASNTAPQYNGSMTLKESMEAAGGKLRMEDLVVPLLWGENISSAPKQACSAGKF